MLTSQCCTQAATHSAANAATPNMKLVCYQELAQQQRSPEEPFDWGIPGVASGRDAGALPATGGALAELMMVSLCSLNVYYSGMLTPQAFA